MDPSSYPGVGGGRDSDDDGLPDNWEEKYGLDPYDADEDSNDIFRLVKCNNCGLHYINPRPTKQHIGYYYSEDYYAHIPRKDKNPKKRNLFLEKWMSIKKNIISQ